MFKQQKLLTVNELNYIQRSTVVLASFFWFILWISIFMIVFAVFPMLWINPAGAIFLSGIGFLFLLILYFFGAPYKVDISPYSYSMNGTFKEVSTGTGDLIKVIYTFNGLQIKQPRAISFIIHRLANSFDQFNNKQSFDCRLTRFTIYHGNLKSDFYIILNIKDFFCIDYFYQNIKPFNLIFPAILFFLHLLYTIIIFFTLFLGIATSIALLTQSTDYLLFTIIGNIIFGTIVLFKFPDRINSLSNKMPTTIDNKLKCDHRHHRY